MIAVVVLVVIGVFIIAYRFYGGFLSRQLQLDDKRPTPAVEMSDGVDYVPANVNPDLAFTGFASGDMSGSLFGGVLPLMPFLFITVACGACSGFHGIVASGTTSKQLAKESDAKCVGYGAMLLEGLVARGPDEPPMIIDTVIVGIAGTVLLVLSIWLIGEAFMILRGRRPQPESAVETAER